MGRNFSALEKHGRREYKFAQADSYGLVNKESMQANYSDKLANGVCMGVTLNWIKEKLAASNSLVRPNGRLLTSDVKRFSNPLNPVSRLRAGLSPAKGSVLEKLSDKGKSGVRNQTTMLYGAITHGSVVSGGRSQVARDLGLQPSAYEPQTLVTKGADFSPIRVAGACISFAGSGLPKGNAVLVEIDRCDGPGHAIAFYRSRGGVLYFFDSNAGVYSIFESQPTQLEQFVAAWLDVYRRLDGIEWQTTRSDWYASFNR